MAIKCRILSSRFAPNHWATQIENPLVSPFSHPVTKKIREPVLPIAAKALTPKNCPATIESTIL